MWFNSTQREEPYPGLKCERQSVKADFRKDTRRGAAWLSSARVVRCWVKSRNERNPCLLLPSVRLGTLRRLPVINRRKVGMTSSQHGLYVRGYTRATMAGTERRELARVSESLKVRRSPDWSLQLDSMKSESLVIVNQQCRGEYVPGPCTHRPSHHGSWLHQKWVV